MCAKTPFGQRREQPSPPENQWVILLAAGEGSRVRDLTRNRDGVSVPKQFCAPGGGQSMLCWAMRRAARIAPIERIVVVVAAQHRHWWQDELSGMSQRNLAIQPHNRGTAVGILFPLLQILGWDPGARVLVLPSDHYVGNEAILHDALMRALASVDADGSRIALLGMPPGESDSEYGWILPSCPAGEVCRVREFVEKPDRATASALMCRGAVLNSFIIAGTGACLERLYLRSMPRLVADFVAWRDDEAAGRPELEALYRRLPTRDFSRDVLQRSCDYLSVVRAIACGWSDLGTPDRLRHHWGELSERRTRRSGVGGVST